jgi:hypothetical protein
MQKCSRMLFPSEKETPYPLQSHDPTREDDTPPLRFKDATKHAQAPFDGRRAFEVEARGDYGRADVEESQENLTLKLPTKEPPMRRFTAFLFFCFAFMFVIIPSAYAQAPSEALPPLSLAVGVSLTLSLLIGVINQGIQSGSFLGIVTTPKTWLPGLATAATFLSGVAGYWQSLTPFTLNLQAVVYGIYWGIAGLIAGVAPGLAHHAHSVVPEMARQVRLARLVKKNQSEENTK